MSEYADRKITQRSYRPKAGTMSPGLKRAREPYKVKNAVVGLALGAFAVGVWAYSISAVKQDVFDDVDEEAKALASLGTSAVSSPLSSAPALDAAPVKATNIVVSQPLPPAVTPPSTPNLAAARGVLQALDARWPGLLDPQRKTLVWGAPSVDNVGKLWS